MWQWDLLFYLIVVVGVVLLVILGVLTHAGCFYTVRIRMGAPPVLPHHVAYILRTGPYEKAGDTFYQLAKLSPKTRLFGIYYDDPDVTPKEKLRYIVGCCLPDLLERGSSMKNLEAKLQSHGYQFYTFPSCEKVVITEYPWRNRLSIILAVFFVYPALKKYVKQFKVETGPCIEYYEKDFIRFILPIDNREGFRVPEVGEQHH